MSASRNAIPLPRPPIIVFLRRLRAGPLPIDDVRGDQREAMIDAGMSEPPLVDTEGPRVLLTEAGCAALDAFDNLRPQFATEPSAGLASPPSRSE